MRQKIQFKKNIKNGTVTILESSEVDPGVLMPLHEEDYALEDMISASKHGRAEFTDQLRRRSFFPTSDLCNKLYENTKNFFKHKQTDKITIEYDDSESFPREEAFHLDDEDIELDKILEEDGTSDADEIKEIDTKDDTPKVTPEDTSEHEN